jgi:hypothetical protein
MVHTSQLVFIGLIGLTALVFVAFSVMYIETKYRRKGIAITVVMKTMDTKYYYLIDNNGERHRVDHHIYHSTDVGDTTIV